MSGIRQHTIPRSLIKGFSEVGKDQYVWVHKKDGLNFKTNINNVSVVKSFYTPSGKTDIDDLITKEETAFSTLIDRIRNAGSIETKDYQGIASFIAHLELRTLHIRTSYEFTLNYMLEQALSLLDTPKVFEQFLSRSVATDFENRAKAYAADTGKSNRETRQLIDKARLVAKKMLPELVPKFLKKFDELKKSPEKLKSTFQAAAESAQITALGRSISPEEKVIGYKTLVFTILKTEPTLPLGDSAVLFHTNGNSSWKSATFAGDQVDIIALPIRNDLIIIGHKSSATVDLKEVRTAIARCSLDYIISKNEQLDPMTLAEEIGKDALPFTAIQINELVRKSLGLV
ncbi:DUF4238 domain-containing protein [Hydrogenophaga aromaticivorans]|uniref:DUF4238 domain-containing protein n=1 Tax=Hydrogenophaga aromaticivorans TaxID=2610898 RepID=UPI001B37A429|nr:DUF4238 domain-containing protein [Hydrogenophaga aromaticivorans]MBQ0921933.1 DUF4238 domain-containing protein [Hydrogenophaga aromaticivorans]